MDLRGVFLQGVAHDRLHGLHLLGHYSYHDLLGSVPHRHAGCRVQHEADQDEGPAEDRRMLDLLPAPLHARDPPVGRRARLLN